MGEPREFQPFLPSEYFHRQRHGWYGGSSRLQFESENSAREIGHARQEREGQSPRSQTGLKPGAI